MTRESGRGEVTGVKRGGVGVGVRLKVHDLCKGILEDFDEFDNFFSQLITVIKIKFVVFQAARL